MSASKEHQTLGWPPRSSATLLLILVSSLLYWNSLPCSFVFDDVSAVKENRDLRPNTPLSSVFLHDFWGTPMHKEQSHKSYRPVTVLTFRTNYALHGLEPAGYHLTNVCLHVAVTLIYHRLTRAFVSRRVALVAALLFAVHPVHTEAVTGVVGRAELLSSLFFLLAVLAYRRSASSSPGRLIPDMVQFVIYVTLATFSKEQGITVLGVCFVYEIFVVQNLNLNTFLWPVSTAANSGHQSPGKRRRQRFFQRTLVIAATGCLLMLLRFYVMGATLPVFTNFDNPASYERAPTKQLTWSYLIAVNAWLLLNPSDLCCDWTMGTIPLVRTLADPRNLATIVTFVTLVHLGLIGLFSQRRRHRHVIIVSLSLLALPFLPASNLFFPVGFVVAERILYLPSMGFCLLVAYGLSRLSLVLDKRLLKACLGFLLLVHSLKSVMRNEDWKDELSIFRSGLKVNSGNAKLFNNVGHALESQEKYAEALSFFQMATSVQPDDIGAHINVGRTYNNLRLYAKAEQAYLLAKSLLPQARPGQKYMVRIAPQHLSVFLNLANLISKDVSRLEEADALYKQAISMRSDYIQAYINRGDVLIKMNRSKEAQEVYEKALTYESDNPDLYYNLGVVYIEQSKPEQALLYFDKALEIDPEHVQALMNSAILIQETNQVRLRPVAYKRLFKVLEKIPDSDRVFFNLGMLGMDDHRYVEAETWFKQAIEIKPDFRSALFNLALLLNEQQKPLEAIPFLRSLLSYFPDHVKGLVLLGDIYTNHVKDYERAEECYQRIIQIDASHIQARHNLCVVMVEKGELTGAKECLKKVQVLAPSLEYVGRHLAIVENRIKLLSSQKGATEGAPEGAKKPGAPTTKT